LLLVDDFVGLFVFCPFNSDILNYIFVLRDT